jgi:alpha-glucosidase (family GH31 glycosyl hydrolase)
MAGKFCAPVSLRSAPANLRTPLIATIWKFAGATGSCCNSGGPGDRDHQNLGGTLRSLDRYAGEHCALKGVSPAGMESPDPVSTMWPAWLQCEVDPLYKPLHPNPPEELGRGNFLSIGRQEANDGRNLHRTFNWYKEAGCFPPGILSRSGYFFLNDSESAVLDADGFPVERARPGSRDWYFFAYGSDYLQALRDFRLLSGPAPIPTHRTFGIIFSRWPAFAEDEIRDMAARFAAEGYPLSTLVMDMEWHKDGWGHWEFNPDLIPDPERFFALCREHGLEVVFNDHPLDVREDDCHYDAYVAAAGPDVEIRERDYNGKMLKMAKVDITEKKQNRAFVEICSEPILRQGLDYWWNDGSRGQFAQTAGQLVTNKSFFEASERDGHRGMLFARYGGLGSHRYGAFFTGDANSDWHVLRLQCEFNIRAAGAGLSHISHDIGGFMMPRPQVRRRLDGVDAMDLERYVRWLQFGVMGPVLRFHSAPGCGSRLPYDYDAEAGGACRKWLRIRHALMPYLYTAAEEFRRTGIPLTRGLFLTDPDNTDAYRFDQYYLGPDLLVAPILAPASPRRLFLPPGQWSKFGTSTTIDGGREIGGPFALDDYPVYVRAGTILPMRDPDAPLHSGHIDPLVLELYPGAPAEAFLYEDDGRTTGYLDGAFCRTRFTWDGETLSSEVIEGCPLGDQRMVTVRVFSGGLSVSAEFSDGVLPLVQSTDGVVTIQVGSVSAARAWQMRVHFSCVGTKTP